MNDFENALTHCLDSLMDSKVKDAMLYSLCAGGKRIRPQLLFSVLKAYGCDEKIGYKAAIGIEMIHTYSLIHDDLPCMDNDDLRRGKPTCHIQFDEATAMLAGDALLTQAFLMAASACEDASINLQLVALFAKMSGADGMIYGQICDLQNQDNPNATMESCLHTDHYKTGCLLTLPLLCGALLSHHETDLPIWEKIGYLLGEAFQIQDDILDIESNEETMGKSLSDIQNNKVTYVSLLGIDQAKKRVGDLFEKMNAEINKIDIDQQTINELMNKIYNRKH